MRKRILGALCLTTIGACACVWAADWASTGGNPRRDGYSLGEKALSKESVTAHQVKLVYKYKFDNVAKGLDALTAPIDLGALIGYQGFKELVFIGGSSDTVYSIDSDEGVSYFKTKLDPLGSVPSAAPTPLCSGGLTANVAMTGDSAAGRRFGGGGLVRPLAVFFAVSSDGYLRTIRQQDGNANYVAPVKFLPAGSQVSGLNVNNDIVYASTINGCNGNPNGLYAATFTPPRLPDMPGQPVQSPAKFDVTSFMTNGSGFSGDGGTAAGKELVYGQVAEGHGDVAGKYNDTVLALDPKTLTVKDYFTPANSLPAIKAGVAAPGVTPTIFEWNGKEVVVAGSRDGRIYLLDGSSLGGSDHHTPFSKTEAIVKPGAFDGNGIWGTFSTWEDTETHTRWLYAAIRGESTLNFPAANGAATTGAIVAFKVVDQGGKPTLSPQWISGDMVSPAGPITANGLVFALSTGENPRVAQKDGKPYTVSEIEKTSRPAVLHILDAATGKDLYSGSAATTFAHSGIALANGRVYFTTHDNTLYAYGIPILF